LSEELADLTAIVREVIRRAVISTIAVPGRKINAQSEAVFLAGLGDFFHDVAFSVAPGTVLHGVFRELRRPKAESVVMFAGEDEAFHSRLDRGPSDLVGIKVGGVEHRFLLVAISPFLVGEGVHREMEEAVEFHFMPAELAPARHRSVSLRRRAGIRFFTATIIHVERSQALLMNGEAPGEIAVIPLSFRRPLDLGQGAGARK
jgi:hypothetical protein